jgi:hypothetical protein
MTAPLERDFQTFARGEIREEILRGFRLALRLFPDPATDQPFTEDQIRRVTMFGSRFYAEADAIDLVGLGHQKRDEYLATQLRIDRAASPFLVDFHGALWGEAPLPATGGTGNVTALANSGVVWLGSTTVPDPLAVSGRDPAGNVYQVFVGGVTPGSGQITLTLVGVSTGRGTNPVAGTIITWENPPVGAQPTATVDADFVGGLDRETDEQFAARLGARIRHKPGAGNWSMLRDLARQISNAVDDAFVYPTALHAGSVLVAVTAKRGETLGPLARVPSLALLTTVTGALVPPGSPEVPARAFVVVTGIAVQSTPLVVQLAQRLGSPSGWTDEEPWPSYTASFPAGVAISAINVGGDPLVFDVQTDSTTPSGAPKALMHWQVSTSTFQSLSVASVAFVAGTTWRVGLTVVPSAPHVLAVGDLISPDMTRRDLVGQAVVDYFDELGPGEVVASSDIRASRAYRNPEPSEERPSRAGQQVVSRIADALGPTLAAAFLNPIIGSTPLLPADVADGPSLLVLGKFAVYDLP